MPKKKTNSKKSSSNKKKKKNDVKINNLSEAKAGSIAEMVVKFQQENSKSGKETIFREVIEKIDPLIKRIVNKFNIPGYEKSDLYQEALYAVRFKAMSDFDLSRIIGDDFVGFEKFAALCVKRHLSTLLKCSFQNKKATLNTSVSFHTLTSEDSEESFDMSSLMNAEHDPQDDDSEKNEIFRNIISNLMENLSDFEKKVLALYSQRFSYEEIAESLNKCGESKKINIKGVDNALSRIKIKAKIVVDELGIDPF